MKVIDKNKDRFMEVLGKLSDKIQVVMTKDCEWRFQVNLKGVNVSLITYHNALYFAEWDILQNYSHLLRIMETLKDVFEEVENDEDFISEAKKCISEIVYRSKEEDETHLKVRIAYEVKDRAKEILENIKSGSVSDMYLNTIIREYINEIEGTNKLPDGYLWE